jgi:hypothetical protein
VVSQLLLRVSPTLSPRWGPHPAGCHPQDMHEIRNKWCLEYGANGNKCATKRRNPLRPTLRPTVSNTIQLNRNAVTKRTAANQSNQQQEIYYGRTVQVDRADSTVQVTTDPLPIARRHSTKNGQHKHNIPQGCIMCISIPTKLGQPEGCHKWPTTHFRPQVGRYHRMPRHLT